MVSIGTLLRDYLKRNKISQSEFAQMINVSKKHVSEILSGKTGISLDTLTNISLITGEDINLLIHFNEMKKCNDELTSKYKSDKEIKEYLKSLNIYDMEKCNWISLRNKDDYDVTLLDFKKFIRNTDINSYNNYIDNYYLYKKSDKANMLKVALWITHCNSLIEGLELPDYTPSNIDELFKELELERCKEFNQERLIKLFNKYGIILIIEEPLKGTKVRGVTHVKVDTPVIYMNTYYKNLSSFYFALYHELGHVKKHYNMLKSKTIIHSDDMEDEIDEYALSKMIPDNIYSLLIDNELDAKNICKQNNIPLSFFYSRLAYEGRIKYTDKKYIDSMIKIEL